MSKEDLQAGIAEALEESEFEVDDDGASAEWDAWDTETEQEAAAAPDEDSLSKGTPKSEEATSETQEGTDEEPPLNYWGVNLEGIPAEKRAEIIAHFEQQDSTVHKLQERLNAEPEAPAPPSDEELGEPTDEDLLRAMGLDPEAYETQSIAPAILPLARTTLALEQEVEQMRTKDIVETTKTTWNTQLDELEEAFGPLGLTRVQVLRYAAEEKAASPADAYFKLAGGPRKEVADAVAKARLQSAKREASAGPKPRSSNASTRSKIDPKTMSLRDAVKEAMKETEAETGLKFRNLFKGGKVQTD